MEIAIISLALEMCTYVYVHVTCQEAFFYLVHQEHRKLHSLTELNAKFRYIQLCRSLKTYGVTFFLVKEKMKGRNKLIPRLLGVTRESVMRVDETTKEASTFSCLISRI